MTKRKIGSNSFFWGRDLLETPAYGIVALFSVLLLSFSLFVLKDPLFMHPVVIANNAISLTLSVFAVIILFKGLVPSGFVIGFVLAEYSINLYILLFFVLNTFPQGENLIYTVALIFYACAFASILLSIGVGRVLGLSTANLSITIFALVLWLYPSISDLKNLFLQYAAILAGISILTYYFRTFLLRVITMRHETLQRIEKVRDLAERWGEEHRPFIQFGRNTAGLIHDFRNYVHVLTANTQVQLIRLERGKPLDEAALEAIQVKIDELTDRISLVNFAVSASPDFQAEEFNVHDLVRSVIYPFTISKDIRFKIELGCEVPPRLFLVSYRQHLLRILENLVRNSCEAIMETFPQGEESHAINYFGRVIVRVMPENNGCTFLVEDTGPGIALCNECKKNQACMECQNFKIGKTSKSYGSGWGMVNVRERVKDLEGQMTIKSQLGQGTSIRIWVPRLKLLPNQKSSLYQSKLLGKEQETI